jgi:hypothetical protein
VRLDLREIENLSGPAFVLLAGSAGGVLEGVTELVHYRPVGAFATFVMLNAAAVILWWLGVRRRQYSVWHTALQLTLIIGLAQLISFALVIPRAVPANVHLLWPDVVQTELVTQLTLSAIRFPAAIILVVLGRFLPGSGRSYASATGAIK